MQYSIVLRKMETENGIPIKYFLMADKDRLCINDYLLKKINITFNGKIYCINCGKKIKKTYGQGFCYNCFLTVPEAEECILRPELCRAHEGIARDMEYAKNNCLIEHYVYFASTNLIKVGVTRITQVPTRWIDQGADRAIVFAKTPNRYTAGIIEVALKKIIPDKTNWRSMLTSNNTIEPNFDQTFKIARNAIPEPFKKYIAYDNKMIYKLYYPINELHNSIHSINLDKQSVITDILIGIKGQYLIFSSGKVINIRNHTGYEVIIEA